MRFLHIPKVELHCHVDGIVDPAMLREIEGRGISLPVTSQALQAAYPVRNFDEFIHWFQVAEPIEDNTEHFKPVLAAHIERLIAQNVTYTEIMLGTSELPRDDGRLIEAFGQFREFVTGLEGGKIQVEFLVAVARNRPPERLEALADRLVRLREANLVFGVALAGWPEAPIKPLGKTLARLREAGVGIEIHAGEWAGPESVWDALEHGSPHRIGHGVAIFQDPRLVERFQKERIHIEMCPTSNVRTGSVERLEAHPIPRARDLSLSYSVSTDDPGPFECSLESEYELLAEAFGFQEHDFAVMAENALSARFQPQLRYAPHPLPPSPVR
jgi:adenosine deaminase